MLRRYKEIIYGVLLGLVMWVVDAGMHAQLGAEVDSSGFLGELLHPGSTQLLFRGLYVGMATACGWALWRSNWRERELRALEDAIIAFNRQLGNPAMRIVSHIRMLQGCSGVTRDEMAMSLAESISSDAHVIDHLAQQYIHFSEQVMAGRTSEAIETLRSIEVWLNRKQSEAAKPAQQSVPSSPL